MVDAVIVDAVRTPGGKRGGALSGWHPTDLSGFVLEALVTRNGLDPALVDDVVWGCVSQVGEQALNIGRYAALAAGFPTSVPGTTVHRQCGSSQQAAHFAAQGVIAGAYDVVIAGGVESMSRVPMGSSTGNGPGEAGGERLARRFDLRALVSQGIAADLIADAHGLSREDLDAYAVQSHQRAATATAEGRFEREIVPVPIEGRSLEADEGIRPDANIEALGGLRPVFQEGGRITAGNSSQICDGASAVLIMSEERAARLGLRPRARFHAFAVVGSDPILMLDGPIAATTKALDRAKLALEDIDVFEVNEAFASVVLAWERAHRPDMARVNVNGGAIALGHPLGASGTKLLGTLLNELERTGGRYGMQLMCEGGGMANATVIERLG